MNTLIKKFIITFILGGLFYFGLAVCCFMGIWPSKDVVIFGTCIYASLFVIHMAVYAIQENSKL